jgi:hypothetical protein
MTLRTHRDRVRPIIARIIESAGTKDMKSLRAALRAAYPYGVRKYWPYKVWCSEIQIQLGLRKTRFPVDRNTIPMFPEDK